MKSLDKIEKSLDLIRDQLNEFKKKSGSTHEELALLWRFIDRLKEVSFITPEIQIILTDTLVEAEKEGYIDCWASFITEMPSAWPPIHGFNPKNFKTKEDFEDDHNGEIEDLEKAGKMQIQAQQIIDGQLIAMFGFDPKTEIKNINKLREKLGFK